MWYENNTQQYEIEVVGYEKKQWYEIFLRYEKIAAV